MSKCVAALPPLTQDILKSISPTFVGEPWEGADDDDQPGSVSPDTILLAHLLGAALAPHFESLDGLANTKQFIAIAVSSTIDAMSMGRLMRKALPISGVNLEPQFRLELTDNFVILLGSGFRMQERMALVTEAARHSLPVAWLYNAAEGEPSDFLAVADLKLDASAPTLIMLAATFDQFFGRVPENLGQITLPEKLSASDLALHCRNGRSPEASVDSLLSLMPPPKIAVEPNDRFDQIVGYGEAKSWGLELATDLEQWRSGQLNWDEFDHRSLVLVGPPGTGKTAFAALLAAKLKVPLLATSVAQWNAHDHLSGALKQMRAVFKDAMQQAPAVLFIDELDGISSRGQISGRYSEYWTQIVNALLELVTEASNVPGLILLGATNFVGGIDPALLRAGRLDRITTLQPPTADEAATMLSQYLAPAKIESRALVEVATALRGKTGADIEKFAREAKSKARRIGQPMSATSLLKQVTEPFDKLAPQVRRRISAYVAGQTIVAKVLGLTDYLAGESAAGNILAGGIPHSDVLTLDQCNDFLTVLMAGKAAEEILLGDMSSLGGGRKDSDLAVATKLASNVELKWGMGEQGLIYSADDAPTGRNTADIVPAVRRRVSDAMARASALLLAHRQTLEEAASWSGARPTQSRSTQFVVH